MLQTTMPPPLGTYMDPRLNIVVQLVLTMHVRLMMQNPPTSWMMSGVEIVAPVPQSRTYMVPQQRAELEQLPEMRFDIPRFDFSVMKKDDEENEEQWVNDQYDQ